VGITIKQVATFGQGAKINTVGSTLNGEFEDSTV